LELKAKIGELETELSSLETRSHDEMATLAQGHSDEIQQFRDENRQLALTVCELEESLDKATTKVKEYKLEITSLERSLAGPLTCNLLSTRVQCRSALTSTRQHPSYGDCLEVKREYYQNCSVLGCVTQCSQSAAHSYEQFLQVQQIGFVTLGPLRHA